MVAEPEIVRDRLNRIRRYVRELRDFSRISEVDFLRNVERQYAVLHALQLAIEASIEIATHICSSDALGIPTSYAEAFDALERAGVVDSTLASDLRAMARFRNRIVHLYWDVGPRDVYVILQERLEDFDRYAVAIEKYLAPTESREQES
ncbi:MAG: type VII toxin-antitoxin system HepT family RNase toxin [Vicinamibacteria bacterium]